MRNNLNINHKKRFSVIAIILMAFFALIFIRLLILASESKPNSKKKIIISEKKLTYKGDILDRNNTILATNVRVASLYADPKFIDNPEDVTDILHEIFPSINRDRILKRLSNKKSRFAWIKRELTPKQQQMIHNLGIVGLGFTYENKRLYPHQNIASHIVGFVNIDGNGLAGVEKTQNDYLKKQDLVLSLDINVQYAVHEALLNHMQRHSAKAGAAIVMDIHSSEIIALVSLPDFNPNKLGEMSTAQGFNHATNGVYELGSVFKPLTIANALDNKIIDINDKFDVRKPLRIGKYRITDHHPENRILSVAEVLIHSSNIGTGKIADMMLSETQRNFFKKLGMFKKMNIEINEKASPITPKRWKRTENITISYGHGLAITPLHMINAFASIINGGIVGNPTIIKDKISEENTIAISNRTSKLMSVLLRQIVLHGTGKNANAKGYMVGGKTGTAEKIGTSGYDKKRLVTSFVGAFPMHKPQYAIIVTMDEPQGIKETYGYATAGYTAAPVVKNIINSIAPILNVAPVDEARIDKLLLRN